MDISGFALLEKLQWGTWYVQMQATTAVKMNIRTGYPISSPTYTLTLRWVNNLNNLGNIENRYGRERPSVPVQKMQTVNYNSSQLPELCLPRSMGAIGIPCSTLQTILKELVYKFGDKIIKLHQIQYENYGQQVAIYQSCMVDRLFNFDFNWQIVFSNDCFSRTRVCWHSKHLFLGGKKWRELQYLESD